jgi:hypothetical protein
MMKKLSLLIVIACFLTFSGCKKDKDEVKVAGKDGRIDMLVGKNWKLTAYTENGADALQTTFAACERDNIDTYLADGSYKEDEGPTKCNQDDSQIVRTAKWRLDGSKLIVSQEDLSIEYTIITLNSTTLKYQVRAFGVDYIYTYTA